MIQCPRCASEITKNDKVCPRCGLPVEKMDIHENEIPNTAKLTRVQKQEKKKLKKIEEKKKRKEEKLQESISKTDFNEYSTNVDDSANISTLKKKKINKKSKLKFDIDENGEYEIDTKDVEIVGEEVGKIIEERTAQTYSIKKARGDYREPKIKWWELYKIADRMFARRKIKKEVTKAAKIKPDFVSKAKLLLLAIFFGWTGAHNFYAKNKRKGWVSIISLIFWVGVISLAQYVTFFARIQISIGGFAGFINIFIWVGDAVNIIFNNFRYRIQSDAFIFKMNVKTRAKLGEKYIDLDLYQKQWWVRFKVWCQKKKRGYEEWKHDRRQRLIQKEKEKLERQAEQDKINSEIADFEAKEDLKFHEEKIAKMKETLKDTSVLDDIKDSSLENQETNKKEFKPSKKAKVSVKTKNKKNNKK